MGAEILAQQTGSLHSVLVPTALRLAGHTQLFTVKNSSSQMFVGLKRLPKTKWGRYRKERSTPSA